MKSLPLNSRTIIFDGAMGTELQKRGLFCDPATLNLSHPEDIIDIHQQYLEAGADIITANTFGAYSHKYDNASDMIRAAIAHGRKGLENYPGKWLALDLGPTGLMLEPYGITTHEACRIIYDDAIQAASPQNIDLILVETMMDITELGIAVAAAKKTGLPVFATMTFDKNGKTMMGATLQDMVSLLTDLQVDAVGMNCGFGPDLYAGLAADLSKITDLPIIVQPNAGLPIKDNANSPARYNLSAKDFAEAVSTMNVKIMGGCCGTSPGHISTLVERLHQRLDVRGWKLE